MYRQTKTFIEFKIVFRKAKGRGERLSRKSQKINLSIRPRSDEKSGSSQCSFLISWNAPAPIVASKNRVSFHIPWVFPPPRKSVRTLSLLRPPALTFMTFTIPPRSSQRVLEKLACATCVEWMMQWVFFYASFPSQKIFTFPSNPTLNTN